MTDDAEPAADTDLSGRSIVEAIDALLAADHSRERSTVREALLRVGADGAVSERAVRDAITATRDALGTPARRIEIAQNAVRVARDRASGLEDVDRVAAELDAFEDRLGQLREIVETAASDLDSLDVDTDPERVLEIGQTLEEIDGEVDRATEEAAQLIRDSLALGDWLRTPERKLEEIETDVGHVEELIDLVEDTTEEVRVALEPGSDARGSDLDPMLLWLDGVMRARLVELLLDDLLSELADVKTVAERTDQTLPGVDALATRLEGLESRRQSFVDRLDRLQRPDWPGEFGDILASYTERLDSEPTPVDWGAVEAELEHYRSVIDERS